MALSKIQTNSLTDAAIQSNRNLIINGSATIHQRGNQTSSSGSAVYFVDRWSLYHNTAAAANLQQSTVVPSGQGFGNSILIDCTTADTSVASSDTAVLRQIIEGQNLQRLAYGTSDAKSITLSFWVRSTKTGTYICNIYHADSTARSQSQQYTISQADTWEKKALIFSGDTSIAADNDNAATFYVQWGLMIGSDLSSGTLNTSWENTVDANRFVGQVNFFDSTSNNFYLTGVQLEVGAETPFEHEDTSTTLRKCQRYYQRIQCDTAYDAIMDGMHLVASQFYAMHTFPVQMREVPTMGENGAISIVSNGADRTPNSFILNRATKEVIQTYCALSGSNVGTAGHAGHIRNNNDADQFVEFKAEL